jgi:lipopolysaccharide transport system ATP-binding protein
MSAPAVSVVDADEPDVLVKARDLGKAYRIWNSPRARVRHAITEWASGLPMMPGAAAAKLHAMGTGDARDFHALNGLNFDIRRGEAVGIVGRNGSGKSTLLQLIAGILEPTAGTIEVSGSVAALLELGSGFSPDFTGRENVYLGCSLMGMRQARIDEEFEGIARFADIDDFIDQPVRTYSSGMLLRLAFAVQTAVEPDLLIVDEALSVGDVFFQAKCMRRMRQLVEKGVTILIVSHSMPTVKEFCERALLLDHGHLILDSDPGRVAARYFSLSISANGTITSDVVAQNADQDERWAELNSQGNENSAEAVESAFQLDLDAGRESFERTAAHERVQDGRGGFLNVQMLDSANVLRDTFDYGETVVLRFAFRLLKSVDDLIVTYHIRTPAGVDLIHGDTRFHDQAPRRYEAGRTYIVDWRFRAQIMHGVYYVSAILSTAPRSVDEPWLYIDFVPYAIGFTMAPRKAGMFGGFLVLDDDMDIRALEGST